MGVGSSTTSRPGSATVLVKSRPPSDLPSRSGTAHATPPPPHNTTDIPTGSCCSHFRKNHGALTRTVTPASTNTSPADDSIDDDIEEIVANTLDLVSNQKTERTGSTGARSIRDQTVNSTTNSAKWDREAHGSAAGSGMELRRTLMSNTRVVQKRPSDEIAEEDEPQYDAKDNLPEVDFAKFKRVNHKGATISGNGRIMHHQESDLLWRLGLISPEAYKMNTGPRSAPSNQGPYLKTPSYDLTEEQLMANIEKEFECTTAI